MHGLGDPRRKDPHGVGGELEGLLADVQLLAPRGLTLRAQQFLYFPPPLHQAPDHLRANFSWRNILIVCTFPFCALFNSL